MPKDTFFNLSEEKKQKIMEAALKEFEQNDYDAASINQIVINSGISKGSFYQYFQDKKDLYIYLMNLMVEKKLKYITPAMMNPFEHSFFEVIREMNQSGLMFARENPQYMKIGTRLLKDQNSDIYKEIMAQNQDQAYEVYEQLLQHAIAKGEVRNDIDVKLTARIIFTISADLVSSNSELIAETWPENLIQQLEKVMALIQHGIANPK
ncbi:TetR/AcrR family transcriptional regulator [Fusibacter bizertensis]|uniref:TetR/AcrR family transcriptional regulator n=1 Tax=Fusibacter bizertensis TaxID=1488331 RepID=A0ABT6NGI1_9FIRM|nr:TetR/AcrR family transcriptional regulator [Fusibacter bizertensis]MDH8679453.1 TetR/AcrR family transcriptional regulator [Fusibacter bizertensis]